MITSNPYRGLKKKVPYAKRSVTIEDRLPELKKQADILFAKWVKKNAPQYHGLIRCYTCDSPVRIAEVDCGHYLSRKDSIVRYDTRNCRCQCQRCNRELSGNLEIFRERLIVDIGIAEVEEIETLAKSLMKLDRHDLLEVIIKYS